MKDIEHKKIHPLVKVGSALGIVALSASYAGCKPLPSTTPEVTSTGTPSALTVRPPVGFEPSQSIESGMAIFRAPMREELVVLAGEGGPLTEDEQNYYNAMYDAKAGVAQKVGIDPNKVEIRYKNNGRTGDEATWMLYYKINGGGVIWPLKPDGALADYPAYFGGETQPDGSIRNLRIDSDYINWVVAGEKDTEVIFGGLLPVIVDSPVNAGVGGETKLVYSRWIRPGGQPADYAQDFSRWQETPGISTPMPQPTEIATSEAGETFFGVLFPVSLKNEAQGIVFRDSTGAKSIVEKYVGVSIKGLEVTPEALVQVRKDYISWVRKLYSQYERVQWNGYVAFKKVPRQEQTISGGGVSFNPENIKSSLWDTSKSINCYVVSKEELQSIYQTIQDQYPESDVLYTLTKAGWILVYSDVGNTNETNVFISIDRVLSDTTKTYDNAHPSSIATKLINVFVTMPLASFDSFVVNNAVALGKKGGFSFSFDWMWKDLGCNLQDLNQSCTYVNISR
jgi:hypothetical protein